MSSRNRQPRASLNQDADEERRLWNTIRERSKKIDTMMVCSLFHTSLPLTHPYFTNEKMTRRSDTLSEMLTNRAYSGKMRCYWNRDCGRGKATGRFNRYVYRHIFHSQHRGIRDCFISRDATPLKDHRPHEMNPY